MHDFPLKPTQSGNSPRSKRVRPGRIARIDALQALPTDDKAAHAKAVRRYLKDRSPSVQEFAIREAIKHCLWQLESDMLQLVHAKNTLVSDYAVEYFGDLYWGDKIQADFLYPLLSDREWLVRVDTIESLARIKDSRSLPLIAERLSDDEPTVRSYAAEALADMRGRKYKRQIEKALSVEKQDRAKVGFAYALLRFGRSEMFFKLTGLLGSGDYRSRCAAANSLASLKLSPEQLQTAIDAVSHASEHRLHRGDGSTMDTVLLDLRAKQRRIQKPSIARRRSRRTEVIPATIDPVS